jgi:hypothetical protein
MNETKQLNRRKIGEYWGILGNIRGKSKKFLPWFSVECRWKIGENGEISLDRKKKTKIKT